MPADIEEALVQRALTSAYRERPPYQRNDYIGWIERTRTEATRRKRIDQMLAELARGGVYMKMPHRPSAKGRP